MSTKLENVFISWSGTRSKHVAAALNSWLPAILQSVKPWLSQNIDKGARPLEEISKALDSIRVGISCLTPENLQAPWILYEGGALSKGIGEKSRLCTYLLGGLEPKDIPPPLGMFQHTRPTKNDTLDMLKSINKAVSDDPVPDGALEKLFEKMWPELENSIKTMPAPDSAVPEKRSLESMVAEVLDMMRAEQGRKEQEAKAEAWQKMMTQSYLNPIIPKNPTPQRFRIIIDNARWVSSFPACPLCGSQGGIKEREGIKECEHCGATNSAVGLNLT
jgi:hypothetical protein